MSFGAGMKPRPSPRAPRWWRRGRRAQRDVLDALAVVFMQELLDLAGLARVLVDRDADLAVGARHRARMQAGELALDVEVADLAEVEELLVEAGPVVMRPR